MHRAHYRRGQVSGQSGPGADRRASPTRGGALPGQRPGGVAISVENTTATIQDIDRENRQVTLKGANGESGDFQRLRIAISSRFVGVRMKRRKMFRSTSKQAWISRRLIETIWANGIGEELRSGLRCYLEVASPGPP